MLLRRHRPPAPAQAPPAAAPAAVEEEDDGADFDAEVAAIFTEEATELLETADHSLSSWKQDRGNTALVFELKRVVHTLKGGARMAGIRAMGNLSHELETLMQSVEAGTVPATPEVFDALQGSLDELHRMRDVVNRGERCASAHELLNRIRALSGQAPIAAPRLHRPLPPPLRSKPLPVGRPVSPTPVPVDPEPQEEDFGAATGVVPTLTESFAAREAASEEASRGSAARRYRVRHRVRRRRARCRRAARGGACRRARPEPAAPPSRPPSMWPRWQPELPPDADVALLPSSSRRSNPRWRCRAASRRLQERQEFARVDADLLDTLLNNAGEVSIFRSRLEQQVSSIEFNLAELGRTVTRLKEQLRKLELETEAQILHRHEEEHPGRADFDPLELDRYSTIQQLSRAFAESVSDVGSIEGLLENLTREAQNLLLQQSRVVTELQNGLMRTRMVPFQRHVQRLSRLVRQVATDTNKKAELVVVGASGELDRQVLERMLPPFEHMLRNSVVHGIETPRGARRAGQAGERHDPRRPASRRLRNGHRPRGRRPRHRRQRSARTGHASAACCIRGAC